MQETCLVGGLTSLQRCSSCILQPQPNGVDVGRLLTFSRDAVGILFCPGQMGPIFVGCYPSTEMQSRFSIAQPTGL